MFTVVNRNDTMTTIHTIIAGCAGRQDLTGYLPGACPGNSSGRQVKWSGGIRGAGQYCCPPAQARTPPQRTARAAVNGMCR
jgi:hypothetical protein